ncbi:MAG TPA: hypothetical protein VD997_03970 [Phycisphaerales bacterium]|nr:hypothetical protein [Phycisphaerales bacterium]
MSNADLTTGSIFEPRIPGLDVLAFNDAVIATLPARDTTGPALVPAMFTRTGDDWSTGSEKRARVLLVAGYFNHFYDSLGLWLDKFEALLRRMHWNSAKLRVGMGWMGALVINYDLPMGRDIRPHYHPENRNPTPPQSWELRCSYPITSAEVPDDLRKLVSGRPGYTAKGWGA